MSSRKRKLVLSEDWRKRIQVGVITDRLMKHLNGSIELTATQINAAKILLAKTAPDLQSIDMNAKMSGNIIIEVVKFADNNHTGK